jgi:hypothetical protein
MSRMTSRTHRTGALSFICASVGSERTGVACSLRSTSLKGSQSLTFSSTWIEQNPIPPHQADMRRQMPGYALYVERQATFTQDPHFRAAHCSRGQPDFSYISGTKLPIRNVRF